MINKSSNSVQALVFDLGGVIIDIDFDQAFSNWSKYSKSSTEEIRSRFGFDAFYESHEISEINSKKYFDSLRESLGIEITNQQFEYGWNSIFIGEVDGIANILKVLKKKVPMYIFSNTNKLHQDLWEKKYKRILSNFDKIFTSSDLKKRKPDPEAFQTVADIIGLKPHQILFFDDLLENIDGAQKIGLNTIHVKSIHDIEKGIKNFIDLN